MSDKILGGGSCVGLGKTNKDTTINEIRQVRDDSHKEFWPSIDLCLDNKIPMYITFDSYTKTHRGWDSEDNLRQFVELVITEFERRVTDKNLGIYKIRRNTVLALDNEFEEVPGSSPDEYIRWLKIFKSQIAGRYKIGAGNFSSCLQFMPWYRKLAQYYGVLYDLFCIHLQADFETIDKMNKNYKVYQQIIKDFDIKRVTCTEGVASRWDLSKDYNLVEYQFNIAKKLNCEGYCAVFIDGDDPVMLKRWPKIIFSRYPDTLKRFMKLIKENKPDEKEKDMEELKPVYKNGMKDELGIKFIQMVLNTDLKPKPLLKIDGWWGDKTDAMILEFQDKYHLAKYGGAVGPNTMQFMIKKYPDVWNNFEYLYRIGSI